MQLICRDLAFCQIELQKKFKSDFKSNRDLLNRTFAVQIKYAKVLKSRFKSQSRLVFAHNSLLSVTVAAAR